MVGTWRASVPASLAVILFALMLARVDAALGAGPSPSASSAISQYVEVVPTSQGDSAPGVEKPTVTKLPPKSAAAVHEEAPAAAEALQAVATSSTYGAPARKLAVHHASPKAPVARVLLPKKSGPPAVPSLAVTLGGGTTRSLVWLGLAIVATTCLLAGAALRQRRVNLPPA